MALTFDRKRISVKGGGTLKIRELDPTPTDSWSTLGFIKDSTFIDEHTMVDSVDDGGHFIQTQSGGQHSRWTSNLMQTTKEEIDVMAGADGKIYEMYYVVQLSNGDYQEVLFPLMKIKPGFELAYSAGTERLIALELHALAPATALTRTPTAYNSAQWQTYVIAEGATANDEPSDGAAIPAAAI